MILKMKEVNVKNVTRKKRVKNERQLNMAKQRDKQSTLKTWHTNKDANN